MKSVSKIVGASFFSAAVLTAFVATAENRLESGSFANWIFYIHQPVRDAGGSGVIQDGKAIIKAPAIKAYKFDTIQLVKTVDVETGKKYKLSFVAKSDKTGQIRIAYCLDKDPYWWYARATVDLTPGERDYECTFVVGKDKNGKYESPRALRMYFGNFQDAAIEISDISLEEVP